MKRIFRGANIKNHKLVMVLFIIGILCLIIGVTFSFFSANLLGIKEQNISIGKDIVFSYNEASNGLIIDEDDALSVEEGKV